MTTEDHVVAELESLVGEPLGPSEWIEMTQEKFDGFAAITGDTDWLHNDPERCKRESPFGGKTIAQGHLLLSHLSRVGETLMPRPPNVVYALNYGYDRVRVIHAVPVGSRIRGTLTIKRINRKDDKRYVIKCDATLEAEGEHKPCLAAEWLFYVQLT